MLFVGFICPKCCKAIYHLEIFVKDAAIEAAFIVLKFIKMHKKGAVVVYFKYIVLKAQSYFPAFILMSCHFVYK